MSKLIIRVSGASGVVYGIRMLKIFFVMAGYAIGWFIPKYPEGSVVGDQPANFFASRVLWRCL